MYARVIPTNELLRIKDSEDEILNMIEPDINYILDEYGNFIIDENTGEPIHSDTVNTGKMVSVPKSNYFYPFTFKNVVSEDVIDNYKDVFDIDNVLLMKKPIEGYDVQFLGVFDTATNTYQGGVWYYHTTTSDTYIGIYGIRRSIKNTLLEQGGISRVLFSYIESLGFQKVVVPWPLEDMIPVLKRYSYSEHNVYSDNNPERLFLKPIAQTHNYWMKVLT